MIERIQAIDMLWDRAENAVKRYQYALKVVESGEMVPIGNRTDRSSSKARKNPERVKSKFMNLAEKQKSQAEVEPHSKKLASARKQLNKIDKELHVLIRR